MPITIGSNIISLNVQRRLGDASRSLYSIHERLASGQRINRASDDAAGLAVADSLKLSSHVYSQAIRNVNDTVSYLNIAEGAVSQLSSIVMRQRELAEQASSSIYSRAQRLALQSEANALVKEYNRIFQSTVFNGNYIIDGRDDSIRVQQGFGTEASTLLSIGQQLGVSAGDGSFLARVSQSSGFQGRDVSSGDFNGDRIVDLVTVSDENKFAIFLGKGDGTFNTRETYGLYGNIILSVSVADFNNDGKLDLVSSDYDNGVLSVVLGNGNGTFNAPKSYMAHGAILYSAETGDFNGDGILDLAAISDASDSVSILLGNGNGTFQARKTYTTGSGGGGQEYQLHVADMNNDGISDLIIKDQISQFALMLGNADGSFQSRKTFTAFSSKFLAVSDLNNDGNQDVLVSTEGAYFFLYLGEGDGTFEAAKSVAIGGGSMHMVSADFNGDGNLDVLSEGGSVLSLALGNGNGTFLAPANFTSGLWARGLATDDLNGDGVPDAMLMNWDANELSIYLGNTDASGRRNNFQYPVNLMTTQSAKDVLDLTTALSNRISLELAAIGAAQSRMSASHNNLQLGMENFITAESRIRDVDVASDAADLARNKILQEAAVAVLAQANIQPQIALDLLNSSK